MADLVMLVGAIVLLAVCVRTLLRDAIGPEQTSITWVDGDPVRHYSSVYGRERIDLNDLVTTKRFQAMMEAVRSLYDRR